MYDQPCCANCGGPFDNIELLDFSGLGEDDQYLKETAYDSQLLSPAQSAVGLPSCFNDLGQRITFCFLTGDV